MENFFDPETGILRLDEIVVQKPSFKRIMEDEIVTPDEIAEQSQLVIQLFKEIDDTLSDEHKHLVANAISEIAVLQVINHIHEIQELNNSFKNGNI